MKSHSPRDKAFMKAFAEKLGQRRERAKKVDGVSYKEFARKLGLTNAGVLNYLNEENVPSSYIQDKVRSVWGVQVGYGDLDVKLIKKRAKEDNTSSEAQMLLPLALENMTNQNISVEIGDRKSNAIELNVKITFSQKRA